MNIVPIMIVQTGRFTWKAVGPLWGHDDDCDRETHTDGVAMHIGIMAKSHISPHHAFQRAVRAFEKGEAAEMERVAAQERGI